MSNKKYILTIIFSISLLILSIGYTANSQMSSSQKTTIEAQDKNTINNRITHFVEYRRGELLETFDGGKSWMLRQPPIVNRIDRWVEQRGNKTLETLDRGRTWRILTKEYESQPLFRIVPSVVNESFDISMISSNDKIKSVTIFDMLGNTVRKLSSSNSPDVKVYMGDSPAGIYHVLVEMVSGKYDMKKIIKIQ